MAGTTYQELLNGVAQYYGSGSDQWAQIAKYGVTEQTLPIIKQVPGVTVTVSNSGKYLGYDYTNPFASTANPAAVIDSNVQTGAYGAGSFNAQLPATAVTNPSTGVTTMQSGAKVVSTGATLATIADRATLALAGVSLGTKLGVAIDSTLYSISPDWWDEHYPNINPETWDDMATTEGGKGFIRAIFGLQNDDATMYMDEQLLAYTYMMLLQNGAYSSGGYDTDQSRVSPSYLRYPNTNYTVNVDTTCSIYRSNGSLYITYTCSGGYLFALGDSSTSNALVYICSLDSGAYADYSGSGVSGRIYADNSYRVPNSDITIYYKMASYGVSNTSSVAPPRSYPRVPEDVMTIALLGTIETPALDGVSPNPEAGTHIDPDTLINPATGQPVTPNDDPADVLQALKDTYPEMFDDSIYEDVPQEDGTTRRIIYIPVPYPDTTDETKPTTDDTPGVDPQTDPQVNPDTRTQDLIQRLIDELTDDPTPPDTGDGDTPPAVIPTGTANALYSIYNPSQSEINSFGAWLWSSNFVDQLLKLFNDPMQAIISLHKVFAQPGISGTSTIKVGYLDSGISSNVVGNQYSTIDCGSVNVSEYFGNVFDYDPFTQVHIYLPFVGIEKLDTGDVMRGRVGVKYHVDVLTGACLAEISVTRDGSGGIIYTYAGNCAVQYPLSSGSYMGIVASAASVAGGVVGTVASGGALAPVAMGAVNGILNAHARVQHSGGFSGNAGAMGVKRPYIIITRPQSALANNFPEFVGYPANKTTTISACSGFIKCEACHVENIPATDTELSEIEMLLKEGIII